jgi:hypothetical protein
MTRSPRTQSAAPILESIDAAHPKPRRRRKATGEDWPWPLRPYQQDAYDKFREGHRRQILIWHRRAGKDMYGMSLARQEIREHPGNYIHCFPKHTQARRALWQGVDPRRGERFIEAAFGDLIVKRNQTEMLLEMENGSTWQLVGSDNYDRIVGSNILGIVFSEWALCDPRAWDYLRPIIRENGGWVLFITTYRGRNHAWRMVQELQDNPDWYVDIRTVDDTTDLRGRPIISPEDIERERAEGMDEALIQQEYYCSPVAGLTGSTYARQVFRIQSDPRRQVALWDPLSPVVCAWNLDNFPVSAAVVMFQPGSVDRPHRILDSMTFDFKTLAECVALVRERPWPIQAHLLAERHEAYREVLEPLRVYPEVVTEPPQGVTETITQAFLDQAQMDPDRCAVLVESLTGYTRRERRSATDGTLMFGEDYDYSWHAWQTQALELGAAWSRSCSTGWSKAPNYLTYDRRRI